MDEEKLEDIAEEGDEGPGDTRQRPPKKATAGSDEDGNDDEESDIDMGEDGVDHNAYFSNTKGGAKVKRDDDDFDDEMGGQSQIIQVATMMAVDGMESDEDIEDTPPDGDPSNQDVKPSPVTSKPNQDAKPSPVTSKSNQDAVPSPVTSGGQGGTANGDAEDDDKTVGIPSAVKSEADDDKTVGVPSPVKSEATAGKTEPRPPSPVRSSENPPKDNDESETPNRSQNSNESVTPPPDGLRTQPTQVRNKATKVAIMGSVFENKKKGDQPKKSGLYLPSYKK